MTNHRDLEARRLAHRPADLGALAREARRLSRQGLSPRDVGELLGIGTGAAAALICNRTDGDAHAAR